RSTRGAARRARARGVAPRHAAALRDRRRARHRVRRRARARRGHRRRGARARRVRPLRGLMHERPPALVLLAAGASSRLGSPKALAPLPGGTPLVRLLAAGSGLGADDAAPLVIAGPDFAAIAAAAPAGVEVARHSGWAAGRTGTVRVAREL